MQQCGIKKKGKHFTLKWVRSIFRIGLAFMTSGLRKVWQKFHLTVSDSYKVFLWHLFSLKLCCCLRDLEAATKQKNCDSFLVFTLLMFLCWIFILLQMCMDFSILMLKKTQFVSSPAHKAQGGWILGNRFIFFSLFLFVKSDTSEQKLHLEIQH